MTVLLMHIFQEETGFPVTLILLSHLGKEVEKGSRQKEGQQYSRKTRGLCKGTAWLVVRHGGLGREFYEPLRPCKPLWSSRESSQLHRNQAHSEVLHQHDRLWLTDIWRFLFNGFCCLLCFACRPDWTQTQNPPAFASLVLGRKVLAACPAMHMLADTVRGLSTWTMTPSVQVCSVFTATVTVTIVGSHSSPGGQSVPEAAAPLPGLCSGFASSAARPGGPGEA